MRSYLLFGLLLAGLLFSCGNNKFSFPQADIKYDPVDISIHRYGKTLFELDTSGFQNGLKNIKDEFELFLDADLDDSTNVIQLLDYVKDSQLIQIYNRTIEVYPDLNELEQTLSHAFGRYQQHFRGDVPTVYTYISDLYFELPVWINDMNLIIAIDVYLGKDFELYQKLGLPFYKIRCMEPDNLPVDVMKALYFNDVVKAYKKRTLLDHMIEGGKMLAYLDAVLPEIHDSVKICYPATKLVWAQANERNIWAFLIEQNLLYSTEYQVQTRLIQDGPFTNGFSNESPARLGIYIGWQIVKRYLKNNPEVSMQELINNTDSQFILQNSGYKP